VSTPSSTKLALLAVGIAVLLWSMSFVLSAEVLKISSPAVLSVGRFAIGLVILLPLAARLRDVRPATTHRNAGTLRGSALLLIDECRS
jgi:drug/metabolite transporter (DMT)-like permease